MTGKLLLRVVNVALLALAALVMPVLDLAWAQNHGRPEPKKVEARQHEVRREAPSREREVKREKETKEKWRESGRDKRNETREQAKSRWRSSEIRGRDKQHEFAGKSKATEAQKNQRRHPEGMGRNMRGEYRPSERARRVEQYIRDHKGQPPSGMEGGKNWENKTAQLPPDGRYRSYDVKPFKTSKERGPERIVRDANSGRSWYTRDHYETFIEIRR